MSESEWRTRADGTRVRRVGRDEWEVGQVLRPGGRIYVATYSYEPPEPVEPAEAMAAFAAQCCRTGQSFRRLAAAFGKRAEVIRRAR